MPVIAKAQSRAQLIAKMAAVSPYAPPRRSSSISISASTGRRRSSAAGTTGQVALLCFLLQYWNSDQIRKVRELIRGYCSNATLPRCIVENRLVVGVSESRLMLVARRNAVLLLNRIVSLVAQTCERLGLVDVARTLRELVVGDAAASAGLQGVHVDRLEDEPFAPVEETDFISNNIKENNAPADETLSPSCCADTAAQQLPRCFARRIRTNMRQIDEVLTYWFGSGSPNASQKSLWMIDSSSVDKRRRVDAEIDERFGQVLCDLVGNDDDDEEAAAAGMVGSHLWKEWCNDEVLYGWRGKVAAIIVLDQMSRHVRRHRDANGTAMPPQTLFDELAYTTSKLIRSNHEAAIQCGMVPIPMQIFGLMPYRHASTIDTVGAVQESVETMAALEREVDDMVRRFRTATNRRMAVLQDEARREGKSTTVALEAEKELDANKLAKEGSSQKQKMFTDDDILENHAFDADLSRAENHPVVKTVISFLSMVGIEPYYPQVSEEPLPNGAKRRPKPSHQKDRSAGVNVEPPKPRHVIVSLSGGVDSMVLANVLSYLCSDKRGGYQHLNVVSVHVDYSNRPESAAEASFVKRYSEKLNVPCTVRRINEVTRGITARDEYEKIARTIRFDLYRATASACLVQSTASDESNHDVGVILGHHRGDLRENVLSNAHKGCGPLDLSGMSSVCRNDGVMIYRPLLPLEKDDVYLYAHSFGVPYFKDTTPHWSTRGKLRNKLLPLLEEIYGEGSMANLTGLARESDEANDLVHKAILAPIFDSVRRFPMGISFDTGPWKDQGPYFWKLALRDILHSASRGMFSDKSVLSFLERAQANKIKPGWLQMRRDYATYLREDGVCFILDPASFPFHDRDKFDMSRLSIECGSNVTVGPWTVTATRESSNDWTTLEQNKAVESMEAFMSGHIRYYVKVSLKDPPTSPRLAFSERFTKIGRPKAWKNSDLKIESTLPLVGADATAEEFAMLKDAVDGYGESFCLVCVTLQLDGARVPDETLS